MLLNCKTVKGPREGNCRAEGRRGDPRRSPSAAGRQPEAVAAATTRGQVSGGDPHSGVQGGPRDSPPPRAAHCAQPAAWSPSRAGAPALPKSVWLLIHPMALRDTSSSSPEPTNEPTPEKKKNRPMMALCMDLGAAA